MTDWFARPIFNVANVELSLRFYVDRLGFTTAWHYDEGGKVRIAQVDGFGAPNSRRNLAREDRHGLDVRLLNLDSAAQIVALDALRAELESKGVAVGEGSWGYRLLVVNDPDGNQLLFNYPAETASS